MIAWLYISTYFEFTLPFMNNAPTSVIWADITAQSQMKWVLTIRNDFWGQVYFTQTCFIWEMIEFVIIRTC